MRSVMLFMGGLARFFYRVIATPIMFGWMIGLTHDWNDELSSNFTYAENTLDTSNFQTATDVKQTTYLAANLIWNPIENVKIGVEYLYGTKEDVGGGTGDAHRLQTSFIFDLP